MEEKSKKLTKETYLLQTLDELEEKKSFTWIILSLCAVAQLIGGMNSVSYVFIAEIPKFCCSIPELINKSWTIDEIKNISAADDCHYYDHNYTYLASLEYNRAQEYVEEFEFLPKTLSCSSFIFDSNGHSTIVNEWELVCNNKVHRSNTFLVFVLGKMVGYGILGIIADKYGRKISLIISIALLSISTPASGAVPWFWGHMIFKFLTGISVSATYSSAYILMAEAVTKSRRKIFVALVECMHAIGSFSIVGLAFLIRDWRNLQLSLTFFVFPTIILIWFVPDSPRWLISQGRFDEAQKIIQKYCGPNFAIPTYMTENSSTKTPQDKEILAEENKSFFNRNVESLKILFSDPILRKNVLIMHFLFYASSCIGYSLVFNIDNFKTDRYIYMTLIAAIELLSYLAVTVTQMFLSRRKSTIIVYTNIFLFMMGISAVPEEDKNIIIGLALSGKFFSIASYMILMLLIAELFPSNVKNSALGTCLVASQLGSVSATYIVDFFGNSAWWAPTTLSGILALIASLLCFLLPKKN